MSVSPVTRWGVSLAAALGGLLASASYGTGCPSTDGGPEAGSPLLGAGEGEPLWPVPPFDARVLRSAGVRSAPDAGEKTLGLLARGARVRVVACHPGCEAKGAWAELEGLGRAPLSSLTTKAQLDGGDVPTSDPEVFLYGVAQRKQVLVFAAPDAGSKILARLTAPRTMALYPQDASGEPGADAGTPAFFRRGAGGYVRASDVRLDKPSTFAGQLDPPPVLAFVRRRTAWEPVVPSGEGPRRWATRYQKVAVLELDSERVLGIEGSLPRAAVRVAVRRPQPAGVPDGAKWVHVDLTEQVLTAYEGERLVFATLVSTGADSEERQSHQGLHRVWYKSRHDRMRGEDYHLEEVPYVQYFFRGEALHGAFWHDAFGTARTHGCVNLSLADARWLFGWAPPELAPALHSLSPGNARLASLWVQVEAAPPAEQAAGGPPRRPAQ